VIALALLLLATSTVNFWPPRAPITMCSRSCAWEGGAFSTRCQPAQIVPDGCRGVPWSHRWGPGNTLARVDLCYRSGITEWCESYFPPIGDAGPVTLTLLPPDPGLIFADGFESGDTTKWSNQ
jgi:hypothetical protein